MERQSVFGQPSYRIASEGVEAWVTEHGGHLAPVTFRLGDRNLQPFHVAPWAHEAAVDGPPIIQALRGDFFCMPFGANAEPFGDERHPLHGESANEPWQFRERTTDTLKLVLETSIRPGRIVKEIGVREGHSAVYVRHLIQGNAGPMPIGHHAMLRFQTEGLVATSPFGFGQVFPGEFERPAEGGYVSLRPGARFDRLDTVPMADGGNADLSRYPARDGFEDLVQVFREPGATVAWNAVTFPEEGYIWFALRDPQILTSTILWHSNGGRHYAPWNGRHRRVLGIEDTTSYMHYGLAGSVADNDARRAGFKTFHDLSAERDLDVRVIFGVAAVPQDFGHVRTIDVDDRLATITDGRQHVRVNLDTEFLNR